MKTVERKRVQHALQELGFKRQTSGKGGHEVWRNEAGRSCSPAFRKADVPFAYLYSLGTELETKAVVSRADFTRLVLGR